MTVGHHLQTAIFLVAVVQGQPGGDADAWLHAQIVLVLVQGLAARAGRLEVEHCLDGEWLAPQQVGHAVPQPRVQHPLEADLIPAVHVDHAGVAFQRVPAVAIDAGRVAGVAPRPAQVHEMAPVAFYLLIGEEFAYIQVALVVVFTSLFVGEHSFGSHVFP